VTSSATCPAPALDRRAEIRDALADIAAPAAAMLPIGLLFGAVAASKGLSAAEVALMSGLVLAGGAQFAALEIWTSPPPLAAILLSTLLINARHVLMSASLAPKTVAFGRVQRRLGMFFLADEIWALSERRAARRSLTPLYYFTLAVAFAPGWVLWTMLGALMGAQLGEPERFGADFAFTALFIGLIAGFWRGPATGIAIVASGVAATAVWLVVGPPWHLLAGATAGVGASGLAHREPKP